MKLEQLMLTKEEIPIRINESDFLLSTLFEVPIHPKLLSPNAKIDERLATNVFPQAAKEWYEDLQQTAKGLPKGKAKEYIESLFLNIPLSISEHHDSYKVDPPGYWESHVITMENGFAHGLSIDRNAGGSLYLNRDPWFICPPPTFSREKLKEFSCDGKFDDDMKGINTHTYHFHNVDYYPGALFLRNWAISYLNAALTQVFKQ